MWPNWSNEKDFNDFSLNAIFFLWGSKYDLYRNIYSVDKLEFKSLKLHFVSGELYNYIRKSIGFVLL